MFFKEKEIKDLETGYSTVFNKYHLLLKKYLSVELSNEKAQEFIHHGFLRRANLLVRCIENIYCICPPSQTNGKKLSKEKLKDLTINLHAFLSNVYGCLDNLAHIWVKEQNVKNKKGNDLYDTQIGFSKKYDFVRNSFSQEFRDYLDTTESWFEYLENFRDALSHRIPPYIPPYVLNKEEAKDENNLEQEINKALMSKDWNKYEELSIKKDSLGHFVPQVTHSFSEKSKPVIFHAQIIADFNTVVEIAEKLLQELEFKNN
jgi:hypothetical protein